MTRSLFARRTHIHLPMPLFFLSRFYISISNPRGGKGGMAIGQTYPEYPSRRGLFGIVTFAATIGRNYPEILKCGGVFNMSRLKSKGATLLRTNEALKINNNAQKNRSRKLTQSRMGNPPKKLRGLALYTRRDDNPIPHRELTLYEKEGHGENSSRAHPSP